MTERPFSPYKKTTRSGRGYSSNDLSTNPLPMSLEMEILSPDVLTLPIAELLTIDLFIIYL